MKMGLRAAIALVIGALLTGCSSDARDIMGQAEASWRKGDYENAIRFNRQAIASAPQSKEAAQALLKIGTIYYRNLRQIRDAINTFNHLAAQFPGAPEEYQARFLLAEIYANEVGDLTQAIAEYDRLLTWPKLQDREEIEFRRADAYFKSNDFDRALRELQRIQESGVTGHLADQIALKIGNIYLIQKRYEDALPPLERVTHSPSAECRRHAILEMAEAYEGLFDFDKAIGAVRQLDATPENEVRIREEVARLEAARKKAEAVYREPERRPGGKRK